MKKITLLLILSFLVQFGYSQNQPPVAVDDYGFLHMEAFFSRVEIDVINNDYSPDGDSVKIFEITEPTNEYAHVEFTGRTITYQPLYSFGHVFKDSLQYRVKKVTDLNSVSNWAKVVFEIESDSLFPVCGDDFARAKAGLPVKINLLKNDYQLLNDTIRIVFMNCDDEIGYISSREDSSIVFIPSPKISGRIKFNYMACKSLNCITRGTVYINVIPGRSYDSLTINNINAGFNARGFLFSYDPYTGPSTSSDLFNPHFEVPKGSGKNTIFTSNLWIGGKDNNGQLHLTAERYRQGLNFEGGQDFFAGPVMDSINYSEYQDSLWTKVWKISREQIKYHKNHWWEGTYAIPEDIATWPGNGDVNLGIAAQLAPYYDYNNDGKYDARSGDYPLIKGDEAVFFIFNDDRNAHKETLGNKMKVEVHGMAYAFDCMSDTAFKNTIFLHYDIYNRSQNTYDSTFIGNFTDFDIGYNKDDYIGCDVERSCFYGYNGVAIDNKYGSHPPAQAVIVLEGPLLDADGMDNPHFDETGHPLCNESVNGTHFGDTISDNERYGMSSFSFTDNNSFINYLTDPEYADEYYFFLKGKKSSSYFYNNLVYYFWYPGLSDTLNWGTNCTPPPWQGQNMAEATYGNHVYDRRGIGSSGPFTFKPGDMQQLDLAYVFARDYTSSDTSMFSVNKLMNCVDIIRNAYFADRAPCGGGFSGIEKAKPALPEIKVFPNPAEDVLYVHVSGKLSSNVHYHIVDLVGKEIITGKLNNSTTVIQTSNLNDGFYLLIVEDNDKRITTKFIKN